MWTEFLNQGKLKELEFAKDFSKAISCNITLASKTDDINKHIDLYINYNSNSFGVDVKSMKKINRFDSSPDENYHWIELQNVNGKDGWLFGKSDYIAFETNEYWVLVSTSKLRKFINKKILNWTPTNKKLVYQVYSRTGRLDKLVLVKTIDLMAIANKIILKNYA